MAYLKNQKHHCQPLSEQQIHSQSRRKLMWLVSGGYWNPARVRVCCHHC